MEKFWVIPFLGLTFTAMYSECIFSNEVAKYAEMERHSLATQQTISGDGNDLLLKNLDEEAKEALGLNEKKEMDSHYALVQEVDLKPLKEALKAFELEIAVGESLVAIQLEETNRLMQKFHSLVRDQKEALNTLASQDNQTAAAANAETLKKMELEIKATEALIAAKIEETDGLMEKNNSLKTKQKAGKILEDQIKNGAVLTDLEIKEILSKTQKNHEKKDSFNPSYEIASNQLQQPSLPKSNATSILADRTTSKGEYQENSYNEPHYAEKEKSSPEKDCISNAQPYQITARHIESKGIGYSQGYTTLDGFFAHQFDDFIPFIDLRGHVFNNGKLAANAGLGIRYIIDPDAYMIGGNVYYDYRNTKHYHYNQIGAGLEAFFRRWEIRANGYLPVGTKRKAFEHDLNWISFKAFSGNNILINENYTDKIESAMRGFNLEGGVHCLKTLCDYDLFVGAGPYYFNANEGKTSWGGKVRVRAEVTKYVYLELSDSYDKIFHNRFQGTVSLSYPFGSANCSSKKQKSKNRSIPKNILCARAVQPPERQEIVVVSKNKKTYTVDPIAIDPSTGEPFFVIFVNNTNTNSSPNGTFENPFANLSTLDGTPNAQDASSAGNILYVFSGDGLTTHMTNGITLKASQRFLGSGISNQFTTTKGVLVVPAQTSSSPSISGSAINVVTLANGTEVSGFNILTLGGGSALNGIFGGSALSGPTTITRNFIQGSGNSMATNNHGIALMDTIGDVLVDSNSVMFTGHNCIQVISNSTLTAPITVTMTNNDCFGASEAAFFFSRFSNTFAANLIVSGNQASQNTGSVGLGFLLFNNSSSGLISAKFSNNIFNNNDQDGIRISTGGPTSVEFSGNQTLNNGANGILVTGQVPASTCVRFINNIATGNTTAAYTLDGTSAPIDLEPPSGNIGAFVMTGTVTSVPPCSCGVCP